MKLTIPLIAAAASAIAAAEGWLYSPHSVAEARRVEARRDDSDRDGLDAWAESRAGTSPTDADTAGDGYSDYYSRTSVTNLTWGELYDDGDGMPNVWETSAGLNPDRFDANDDADADGWTNWEEWMAGTDPRDPASVPAPHLDIALDYAGPLSTAVCSVVLQSYSTGSSRSDAWGGRPDGVWRTDPAPLGLRHVSWAEWERIQGGARGGWNKYFAFGDLNGNGEFDTGEPAGISTPTPSLGSYDSAQATIQLTDSLFGFPRCSWPTNHVSGNSYYTVEIHGYFNGSGGFSKKVGTFKVPKPRNYFHEGDLISAGLDGFAFSTNKTSKKIMTDSALLYYCVYDGSDTTSSTSVQVWPRPGVGDPTLLTPIYYDSDGRVGRPGANGGVALIGDTPRFNMQALTPEIHGNLVTLKWKMDWRNEGVTITIQNNDTLQKPVNNLLVLLPTRHGEVVNSASEGIYATYSACPQYKSYGTFAPLDPGNYTYTITEHLNLQGSTTVVNAYNSANRKAVTGTFTILPESASFHAIRGNVLYWGRACSGANFPTSCVVQAFRLPDGATSGAAPSGFPVAQTSVAGPGEYTLPGLSPGLYAVRAFLDQNGNGNADEWETHGFGVTRGTASPVFYDAPPPLAVGEAGLAGVHVVLHPRDTDNDGLDDDWEWAQSGNLTTKTGTAAELAAFAAAAIGPANATNQPFYFGD